MLGPSFSLYSADEIAELEAALRTDDPEELQRIRAKWAQRLCRCPNAPSLDPNPPPRRVVVLHLTIWLLFYGKLWFSIL